MHLNKKINLVFKINYLSFFKLSNLENFNKRGPLPQTDSNKTASSISIINF